MNCYLLLTIYAVPLSFAAALKVLVGSVAGGKSHMTFQARIAEALAGGGHDVHLLIFDINPTLINYTGIRPEHASRIHVMRVASPYTSNVVTGLIDEDYLFGGPKSVLFDHLPTALIDLQADHCRRVVGLRIWSALAAEHYDVGLAEVQRVCTFGLFDRLGIPLLMASYATALDTIAGSHLGIAATRRAESRYYVPPSLLRGSGPAGWSLAEMAQLKIVQLYEHYSLRRRVFSSMQQLFDSDLEAVMRGISRLFVNTHRLFQHQQPTSNLVVPIGGLVDEGDEGEMAAALRDRLDHSDYGAVLMAFGSFIDPSQMPAGILAAFSDAFRHFSNHTFIWAGGELARAEDNDAASDNIHRFGWIPQKAVLRHPNTVAFVTHGGLNSVNDAALAGVPMMVVPLLNDQPYNAALVVRRGVGVHVAVSKELTADTIIAAFTELLNEGYARRARQLGEILRGDLREPVSAAVRGEVERAGRRLKRE